ncbi:MAG: phnN [Tardiphaga sp.]|nr:phnN [Tardiphaga sp.]
MSERRANAAAAAKIGPGRLVLVVGPSGAGKDTLIDLARAACAGDDRVVFARRVVTREASGFEDNEQLTPEAFRQALGRDAFVVHWQAHGLSYALPGRVRDDVRAGRTVVANISRSVVARLREDYADVVVVAVTAPPDVLAARLLARGRVSDGPIAQRLQRSAADIVPDVTIRNVGDPAVAVRALLEQLGRA